MNDIHCHILPGVDDGAQTVEISVAMASVFIEDGVNTVIATPHFCYPIQVDRDTVHRKVAELQKEFEKESIPLTLLPGNEVRLENAKFFYDAAANDRFCYLGGKDKQFLLLEQAWEGFCPDTLSIIKDLIAQGTRPILAHPERQFFYREQPDLLMKQLELGAWTQVNADSLLGVNGPEAQRFAYDLLDRGLLHLIGSDTHSLKRQPKLSEGYRAIEERQGAEAALAVRDRMASIIA